MSASKIGTRTICYLIAGTALVITLPLMSSSAGLNSNNISRNNIAMAQEDNASSLKPGLSNGTVSNSTADAASPTIILVHVGWADGTGWEMHFGVFSRSRRGDCLFIALL